MGSVYLTKSQKAEGFAKDIYGPIIKALKRKCGELDMSREDFAEHIGVSPDTWLQWRKAVDPSVKKKPGVDVKMVLKAAYLANLKISLEVT